MTEPIRILVPNPSAMTLEGTNTWVLPGTGRRPSVVVDPGPDHFAHLARVRSACPHGIAEIWITHGHQDHVGGADRLAEWTGAPIRALSRRISTTRPWRGGDSEQVNGISVTCIALPGHTSDSIGFLVPEDNGADGAMLFCGDTVLGRGTTQIAWPDGNLEQYLASLDTLDRLIEQKAVRRLMPGHGPIIGDPATRIAGYRRHRLQRLDQVRAAYQAGNTSVSAILDRVYGELVGTTRRAAELTIRAQLEYLRLPLR